MRILETKVYTFDELSNTAKQKAIESLYDLNILHDWYDPIYTEAENLGFKIKGFNIDRANYCNVELIEDLSTIFRNILKEHGENCDTYKLAKEYFKEYGQLVEKYSDGINLELVSEENEHDFDSEANDLEEEYTSQLEEEYLSLLRQEYEYLTSEESIKETITANDYEFTEEGKLI